MTGTAQNPPALASDLSGPAEQLARQLGRVFGESRGSLAKAAVTLGLSPSTLYRYRHGKTKIPSVVLMALSQMDPKNA